MILVIARSRPVKIDFELEAEVSEGGEKIMTAVWKEFFFFSSSSINGVKILEG